MSFNTAAARFSIRREGEIWRWRAYDAGGHTTSAGEAPTRQIAAALVILARTRHALGQAA